MENKKYFYAKLNYRASLWNSIRVEFNEERGDIIKISQCYNNDDYFIVRNDKFTDETNSLYTDLEFEWIMTEDEFLLKKIRMLDA